MDEEKFNEENISNLIRNFLTLRYDPFQKPVLPILNSNDFDPINQINTSFVEQTLNNSVLENLQNTNDITLSLSGGIDSTLVLATIRIILPKLNINAISIKFSDSVDETPIAKNIADFFEAQHETIFVENYLRELPAAISIVGLPFWDIHWYYIVKHAKNKSNFLASGDGGDELFGGYVFRYSKFLSLINNNSTTQEKIRAYLSCHERDWIPNQEQIFNKKSKFTWEKIYSIFEPFFENSLSPLNQVFLADYNGKLLYNFSIISNKINNFFDVNSVAPILDPKLISYASHLPPESKYDKNKNLGKLPLRELLSKFNCDNLVSKEKLGFSVNTLNLWNSIGKEQCVSFLDKSRLVEDGWINKEWISTNIKKQELNIRHVNKFLGLLSLEIWYRIFITKEFDKKTILS